MLQGRRTGGLDPLNPHVYSPECVQNKMQTCKMASCSLLNSKSNAPWKSPNLSRNIAVTLSNPAVFVA